MLQRRPLVPIDGSGAPAGSAVSSTITFDVLGRQVRIVRIDDRWRVTIDEQVFASFLSEGRARAAGRIEARRLHHVAGEHRPRR
jgi:hypothetical protein